MQVIMKHEKRKPAITSIVWYGKANIWVGDSKPGGGAVRQTRTQRQQKKRANRRCNEAVIALHDSLDIFEFQLIIAIELLDDGTELVPILRSARTE